MVQYKLKLTLVGQTIIDTHKKIERAVVCALVLSVGMAGTVFMAGSVFWIVAPQPHILLCIILAIPAFAGWIAPYFLYRTIKAKKTKAVSPYIEKKI